MSIELQLTSGGEEWRFNSLRRSRLGGPFVEALPRHPRCSPDLGARNEVAGQAGQVKSDFER
jgi:hypothetical protein